MNKYAYEFHLENGEVHRFEVHLTRKREPAGNPREHAFWTRLDFHQCDNCPLNSTETPYCPVAVDIEEVAEQFKDILSFERADVRVESAVRSYSKHCDVQTGLNSLLGLIMASGRCPILSQLKPMAHYHLPFATIEETIYRVVGAYLLKQYYVYQEGQRPDLDLEGLAAFYEDVQRVNQDFMKRIKAASPRDANLNAINTLFSLSMMVAMTFLSKLEEIKPLFFSTMAQVTKRETPTVAQSDLL